MHIPIKKDIIKKPPTTVSYVNIPRIAWISVINLYMLRFETDIYVAEVAGGELLFSICEEFGITFIYRSGTDSIIVESIPNLDLTAENAEQVYIDFRLLHTKIQELVKEKSN